MTDDDDRDEHHDMLLITNRDVEALLDLPACIEATEAAFATAGRGDAYNGFRQHLIVDRGAFHVVGGGVVVGGSTFAGFKINGRMQGTVRGVMLLSDARDGTPLALLGTRAFTAARTAAVAVVAARAPAVGFSTALVIGTGRVATATVAALSTLDDLEEILVYGRDAQKARELVAAASLPSHVSIRVANDLRSAAGGAPLIITATSASAPLLPRDVVTPGTIIVALGADAPGKQELEPALLAESLLVVDDLDQCASSGELQHALVDGLMTVKDVYANLASVVCGSQPIVAPLEQTVVIDSTGTSIADVAVAALIVSRARERRMGRQVDFE